MIAYRTWYPKDFSGRAPVIIVSHGGSGSMQGHTRFQHLGMEYASRGFLSIQLNHRASANGGLHRFDRPAEPKSWEAETSAMSISVSCRSST